MDIKTHPFNRHLFIVDNLKLLRRMDNETVDLICIDPPFSKNKTFVGKLKPAISEDEMAAEQQKMIEWGAENKSLASQIGVEWPDNRHDSAAFTDTFTWAGDIHAKWLDIISQKCPALHQLIEAIRIVHSESHGAYITYIGIRMLEMKRVLKSTGSIYIHCDYEADSYLRAAMDAVFGKNCFRNEIVWAYPPKGKGPKLGFHRKHDIILYYGKTPDKGIFDRQYTELGDKQKAKFSWVDDQGRQYKDFKGKRTYLDESRGRPVPSWWSDIAVVTQSRHEPTGYPTQKPVKLAERIILSSTNPGDVVLDCFAGCAYVPVAAERNNRQWIACDISPRAMTVLRRQFHKFHYAVDDDPGEGRLLSEVNITIRGPNQLPDRTDADPDPTMDMAADVLDQPRQFKEERLIPDKRMLEELLKLSGWKAWCCGFANRNTDGSIIETTRNFHLDHITPKSEEGMDEIVNRAPLCPSCNAMKGRKLLNLRKVQQMAIDGGIVPKGETPVNLGEMERGALRIYRDWVEAKGDPDTQSQ